MDKGSLLIALWIIVLVILPFAINAIIKRMRLMKLLNEFKEFAKNQDLNISHHEVIHRKYVIGIDQESKKLAYLKSKNENSGTVINLPDFNNCKVIISDRIGKNNDNFIELSFSPRNNTKSDLKLELYNNPAFAPSADDIEIAQRWAEKANSNLV